MCRGKEIRGGGACLSKNILADLDEETLQCLIWFIVHSDDNKVTVLEQVN